jgi:hypothetical protein
MSAFKKAVKTKLKARVALVGPSGGGKTFSALSIGQGLLPPGGRIAVIDTERGSASKYSDLFDFDVLELTTFEPQNYIAAMNEAAKANYPVLVIDSLTHAWNAKGGLLEQVDNIAKRIQSGNSFAAWKSATPIQNQFVDAILTYPGHIIVTMRVKMEYLVEKDEKTGKQTPKKIGLAPVQRDGLEYEFDLVGDINIDHELLVTKSRCHVLADKVITKPGREVGQTLLAWLDSGTAKVVDPAEDREARLFFGAPDPQDEGAHPWVENALADPNLDLEALSVLKAGVVKRGGFYWTEATKNLFKAKHEELTKPQPAAPAAQ